MSKSGIVLELQRDCLDSSVPVNSILRKAKVIASKLDLDELKQWIDSELNGYDCALKDLPEHRKGVGQPKFFNPYNGWCPIQTADDWFGNMLRTVYLRQSISEIEHLANGGKSGTLLMNYNPKIEETIQEQLPMRMQVALHFSKVEAVSALDFVRNKTLDWTLELENRGITGEGLSFGESEKREAHMVTNHIYGGNFGVLGTVTGDANNTGFVSISGPISGQQLTTLAGQIRDVVQALPFDVREPVLSLVEDLEKEGARSNPVPSKVSQSLSSLREILQNTAGNLASAGILAAIAALASG